MQNSIAHAESERERSLGDTFKQIPENCYALTVKFTKLTKTS